MSAPSQAFALDPEFTSPPEAYIAPEADATPEPTTSPDPPASPRTSANRLNAQLSTGPRTAAGKLRSSLNALRHGLTSRAALLPSEDPAQFQLHHQRFFADLQPLGALEEQLVLSLASTAWRLNRIPALEAALLAAALHPHADAAPTTAARPADPDALDFALELALAPALAKGLAQQTRALSALSMNEARLSRQFDRTLKQLREIQAERRDAEAAQVEVQEVAIAAGPHAGPGERKLGFVLRNNPVDAYISRHARQQTQLPPHPARPLARAAATGGHTS